MAFDRSMPTIDRVEQFNPTQVSCRQAIRILQSHADVASQRQPGQASTWVLLVETKFVTVEVSIQPIHCFEQMAKLGTVRREGG